MLIQVNKPQKEKVELHHREKSPNSRQDKAKQVGVQWR